MYTYIQLGNPLDLTVKSHVDGERRSATVVVPPREDRLAPSPWLAAGAVERDDRVAEEPAAGYRVRNNNREDHQPHRAHAPRLFIIVKSTFFNRKSTFFNRKSTFLSRK